MLWKENRMTMKALHKDNETNTKSAVLRGCQDESSEAKGQEVMGESWCYHSLKYLHFGQFAWTRSVSLSEKPSVAVFLWVLGVVWVLCDMTTLFPSSPLSHWLVDIVRFSLFEHAQLSTVNCSCLPHRAESSQLYSSVWLQVNLWLEVNKQYLQECSHLRSATAPLPLSGLGHATLAEQTVILWTSTLGRNDRGHIG